MNITGATEQGYLSTYRSRFQSSLQFNYKCYDASLNLKTTCCCKMNHMYQLMPTYIVLYSLEIEVGFHRTNPTTRAV